MSAATFNTGRRAFRRARRVAPPRRRERAVAAMDFVEMVDDGAAVQKHLTVVEYQRRNAAERILSSYLGAIAETGKRLLLVGHAVNLERDRDTARIGRAVDPDQQHAASWLSLGLSSDHPLRARIRHIEIVRLAGDRAGLQVAAFVAADRLHLAGIAGGEELVGVVEIGRRHRALLDRDAGVAQKLDRAVARDAGQERPVR